MATRKILVHQNFNQNEIQNAVIQNLSSAPASPKAGQIYYNTSSNKYFGYDGTNWIELSSQGDYTFQNGLEQVSGTRNVQVKLATGANAGNITFTSDSNGLAGSAPTASTSTAGLIEIATDTEVSTGTDTSRAVTPKQLAGKVNKLTTAPTAGTYTKVTINSDGLVTTGTTLSDSDIPNLTLSKITDVTASASELNILDGATLSTTELNYVDGVTSSIQTQLDGKVDENTAITGATKCKITYDSKGLVTAGADLEASDIPNLTLSKITDVTASASEVNILDGATLSTAELNILDGVTATTTELNYVDGVTSNIQTQLDNKLAKKPDGTNDLIDSSNKVSTTYLPDVILGQMLYAGTFVPSTAVATLSDNAKTKLGTTSNTITLTNDNTAITGYKANEGCFYICSADGTFAGLSLLTGDWLISTGSAWEKIDNTDAVTGVKGNAESTYRIGNVNITIDNVAPAQSGNSGKFLTTDGTNASWATVDALPSQTGNNGKYLTTNGTTASWADLPTEVYWTEFEGDSVADLEQYILDGKMVCCLYDNRIYTLSYIDSAAENIVALFTSWGEIEQYLIGIDSYGNWSSASRTLTGKITAQNSALTASGGQCTWTISNDLYTADVSVTIKEVSTNEIVDAEVITTASTITIKINSSSNIAANTYRAIIIG